MRELSDRERHIFVERRLTEDPITLEALGEHYGISRERVRQLENRAFDKVQRAVHYQSIMRKSCVLLAFSWKNSLQRIVPLD